MFERLVRPLRIVLQRSRVNADASGDRVGLAARRAPSVEFVAYAEDCILSGRVRLEAERLTDMLNERDEILLCDVMVERHDASGTVEISEILVARDEILLAQATGPRGSQARRRRTRQHPLVLRVGPYQVHGYFHERPGLEPLAAILPAAGHGAPHRCLDRLIRRTQARIASGSGRSSSTATTSTASPSAPSRTS